MMAKGKFDKYIDLEFSYWDGTEEILFNYNGYDNDTTGFQCAKCGKDLKTGHSFTATNQNEEEWIFGSECVKSVFGVGVLTYKESMKQ